MNRHHEKGLIGHPVSKAKSVILTEAGIARPQELFECLFTTVSEGG